MDKMIIVLKTFTSNSRKRSCQKFHDYLTCEFTALMQECRDETEIYNYPWIQRSNNKFINAMICPDCNISTTINIFHIKQIDGKQY